MLLGGIVSSSVRRVKFFYDVVACLSSPLLLGVGYGSEPLSSCSTPGARSLHRLADDVPAGAESLAPPTTPPITTVARGSDEARESYVVRSPAASLDSGNARQEFDSADQNPS